MRPRSPISSPVFRSSTNTILGTSNVPVWECDAVDVWFVDGETNGRCWATPMTPPAGRRACISPSSYQDCTAGRKGSMGAMNAMAEEWDGWPEVQWRRCEGAELDEREGKSSTQSTVRRAGLWLSTGRSLWLVLRIRVARQPNEQGSGPLLFTVRGGVAGLGGPPKRQQIT